MRESNCMLSLLGWRERLLWYQLKVVVVVLINVHMYENECLKGKKNRVRAGQVRVA